MQIGHGKEDNVNTYLDIFASDLDVLYNFGFVNTTMAPGISLNDQGSIYAKSAETYGATVDKSILGQTDQNGLIGGVLPRGKVAFGLWRDQVRELGNTTGTYWSTQNGTLTVVPLTSWLLGDPVVINAQTGMVGMPEATQNGITLQCLLNPNIYIGRRIQLNNKDINQTVVKQQGFPTFTGIEFYADPSNDGFYRVAVHEFEGDTRGTPWYSKLVVLAIDPSAPEGSQILKFG
jgi:hypothetical protein